MRQLLSERLKQELSGYASGLLLLGSVIGILYATSASGLEGTPKDVVNGMAVALILIMAYLVRSWIVHQPSKSFAHVAQVFSDEHNPWEIHGVVKQVKTLDDKDPVYAESMKPFDLMNKNAFIVDYSNVTVLGKAPFEFRTGLFFADPQITEAELKAGTDHEILYKAFPASVGCVFLVLDLLRVHKVEAMKGVRGEEYVPVFMVRHAPYNSRFENKFKELPTAEIAMLNSEGLAGTVSLVAVQDKVIEMEQSARKEGIKIGRREGTSAIDDYLGVGEKQLSLPSPRAHKKAYAVFGVLVMLLAAAYFLGWFRIG